MPGDILDCETPTIAKVRGPRLPLLIGFRRAKEMLMLGDLISGQESAHTKVYRNVTSRPLLTTVARGSRKGG
jgi:hypothetical protein